MIVPVDTAKLPVLPSQLRLPTVARLCRSSIARSSRRVALRRPRASSTNR